MEEVIREYLESIYPGYSEMTEEQRLESLSIRATKLHRALKNE